jgi:hypothetical protein
MTDLEERTRKDEKSRDERARDASDAEREASPRSPAQPARQTDTPAQQDEPEAQPEESLEETVQREAPAQRVRRNIVTLLEQYKQGELQAQDVERLHQYERLLTQYARASQNAQAMTEYLEAISTQERDAIIAQLALARYIALQDDDVPLHEQVRRAIEYQRPPEER